MADLSSRSSSTFKVEERGRWRGRGGEESGRANNKATLLRLQLHRGTRSP